MQEVCGENTEQSSRHCNGVQPKYDIRSALPEDISDINSMFVEEYGPSYPYPIHVLNPTGLYPLAFERRTGRVVGFAKAVPVASHPGTLEFGGLIVRPECRGHDIAKRMTEYRLEKAKMRGINTVFSEPVCYRRDCASQENLIKHSFVLFGIQPGKYPDLQDDILHGQGESVLMAVRTLSGGNTGFGSRKIFVPCDYFDAIKSFLPRFVRERGFTHTVSGSFPAIRRVPSHRGERTLGAEFVDIPANWSESLCAINTFRNEGFRFACVLPGFATTDSGEQYDFLRLYRHQSKMAESFQWSRVNSVVQLSALKTFMEYESSSTFSRPS